VVLILRNSLILRSNEFLSRCRPQKARAFTQSNKLLLGLLGRIPSYYVLSLFTGKTFELYNQGGCIGLLTLHRQQYVAYSILSKHVQTIHYLVQTCPNNTLVARPKLHPLHPRPQTVLFLGTLENNETWRELIHTRCLK
jgi:hypothetical protein